LLSYPQIAKHEASIIAAAPTVEVPEVEVEAVVPDPVQRSSVDSLIAPASSSRSDWVVRLHSDSGQVYYNNPIGETSWKNPYENMGSSVVLEDETDEIVDDDTEAGKEWLTGYDNAPNKLAFESPHFLAATGRLSSWCKETCLELKDKDDVLLCYPEYLDASRAAHLSATPVLVNIILPKVGADSSVSNITAPFLLTDTVGDLLEMLFSKYHSKTGKLLDESGFKNFVFKVVGFHDYLLQAELPLGVYDCAFECAKQNENAALSAPVKLDLHAVRLSTSEMMDLQHISSRTVNDFLDIAAAKHRPDGDLWTESERRIIPLHISHDAETKTILELNHLRQQDVGWPFRVLINGITKCPNQIKCDFVRVEMNIYFNGESLIDFSKLANISAAMTTGSHASGQHQHSSPATDSVEQIDNCICTPMVPCSGEPRFPQKWLNCRLEVASLPPTARVTFTLVGFTKNASPDLPMKRTAIAGAAVSVVDHNRQLRAGNMVVRMFPFPVLQVARDPVRFKHDEEPDVLNLTSCVCADNCSADSGALCITFDSYPLPVIGDVASLNEVMAEARRKDSLPPAPPAEPVVEKFLTHIENQDPLYTLLPQEQNMLWQYRRLCIYRPKLLPKILQATPWTKPDAVAEMRRMLCEWAPLDPYAALELLDIRYSDPVVREFAIRVIDQLEDVQLGELMLQLVQTLKYECYHDSPLARFLLRRALSSPLVIGHNLYWMLKSEMHASGVFERFGVVLYTYVNFCGPHRVSLRKQLFVNDKIKTIADQIKSVPDKGARLEQAKLELEYLNPSLPAVFSVCLTPRIECKGIRFEKCKVMESKKLPLWVVFENADRDGKDFYTIFKSGDDLRQDQLTLQLLRAMGLIWKAEDAISQAAIANGTGGPESVLDLRLKPYRCCSTGYNLGMIEVVVSSNTTANIQTEYGGKYTGAFSSTPIESYLKENNPADNYTVAVDNFVRTCAGYCVATYVLGIGDRHADNIMLTSSGHLFHIDFGHFLGNFKSKFGINRERSPFVFTPEMAYVMRDTENQKSTYPVFEKMCCEAYNILRLRANMFINMFILMVPAGMPELLERTDIIYLREMLSLELSKAKADEKFIAEIKNSLSTVSRRIDNWIHNLKHKT
jgi:phosphatidylinositol 3-kinase